MNLFTLSQSEVGLIINRYRNLMSFFASSYYYLPFFKGNNLSYKPHNKEDQ